MPAAVAKTATSSNSFNKQLASSNRETRDKALASLRAFLSRKTPFTPLDCLKIWKGLFYCMFMSDKPLNQQRLARSLADLVDVLVTHENTMNFLQAFWKTMSREWNEIDSLRMDKYLYLVRCYVRKGFELCLGTKGKTWNISDDYLDIVQADGGPLSPRDPKVPVGLRLHVADIWVDELDKADDDRSALIEKMVSPLRRLATATVTKSVRERANEALEDDRLQDWSRQGLVLGDNGNEEDEAISVSDEASSADGDFEGFDD